MENESSALLDPVTVTVRNIGGIDKSHVEFSSGVTILTGRNATNRTSFLRSVIAALGGDEASLKSDADEGSVELTIGEETYTREFERQNGSVISSGKPYLDDSKLAELFAFLLESNEARQAVAQQNDLREIIMRPVDTAAIQDEIERLKSRKETIQDKLDGLDDLEQKRARLDNRVTSIEEELEERRKEQEEKGEEVESYDRDVEKTRSEKEELEETLEELNETRSELESVRFEIETHDESVKELRKEREEIEAQLEDTEAAPTKEIGRIEGRLNSLRERKHEIDALVNDLQRIVRFNEEVLEGGETQLSKALAKENENPTDALVEDESIVCWTCGSEVGTERIEETVDDIRDLRAEKAGTRRELQTEIDELTERKRELETAQEREEEYREELDEIKQEIEDRKMTISDLRDRRDELTSQVSDLEDEVESLDVVDEYDEMLEKHRELNEIEFQIDQLEDERTSIEGEIAEIDEQLSERTTLESRLVTVEEELEKQRTEIERVERETVQLFNDHMEQVLGILEYDNLDRIWIERTKNEVQEGRRRVERTEFDLHIVRSTDADVVYEDTIDHLSESEREVTGLIFALAGYLVHDVHEHLPMMLLDSLEAIDSDRIAKLVDYMATYADSLVVALLPEDAAALNDEYERVTNI